LINFVNQNSRMTRFLSIVLASLCTTTVALAQPGQTGSGGDILKTLQESGRNNRISLETDSLLVANYYKFLSSNKKTSGIPGYRIRIYSESGVGAKEEQQRIKARFLTLYPGIDAYNSYSEPFFKIYVGDCRTMSEALKLIDKIERNFPNPFIVDDYIVPKNAD
jgi:hypothetical protein